MGMRLLSTELIEVDFSVEAGSVGLISREGDSITETGENTGELVPSSGLARVGSSVGAGSVEGLAS